MIDALVEWTLTPFTEPTIVGVGWYWVLITVLMYCCAVLGSRIGLVSEEDVQLFPESYTLVDKIAVGGVVVPIIEETLFRIVPIVLFPVFGVSEQTAIVACTGVWVLFHGRRAPFIAMIAPLYIKLAIGGHLLLMLAIHIGGNSVLLLINGVAEAVDSMLAES